MPSPYPMLLSIVIPNRGTVGELEDYLARIIPAVSILVSDFEIVIVDNGSGPAAHADYRALTRADGLPNLQVYHLIEKVDFEIAAWAGVENSIGDYVFVFDPFNEDISILPQALEQAAGGKDIVYVRNTTKQAMGSIQGAMSRLFNRVFHFLAGVDLDREAPHCRLISKRVLAALLQDSKPAARYRTLQMASGFSRIVIPYEAPRRKRSDETFLSRARRALNLLLSSTTAPLRIVSSLALMGAVLNLLYSVYVLAIALVRGNVQPGWTTLSLQQSGMFFLLSIVVFVLSEYLAHSIAWSRGGPIYYIASEQTSAVITRRNKLNVESKIAATAPEP